MINEAITTSDKIVSNHVKSIIQLASSVVIKQETLARKYETVDSSESYNILYMAKHELDTYESYLYIEEELYEVGMSKDEVDKYINDQDNIPYDFKNKLLVNRRKFIIDNYIERNIYYRMLYGLPNTDKEDIFIRDYLDETIDLDGIDLNVPIHKLSNDDIMRVEQSGVLDKIRRKYPNRLYLNRLGDKKIDPYIARMATSFSIIYTPYNFNQSLLSKFKNIYQSVSSYSKRVIYNKGLEDYEHYEAILIIMTLMLSVKQSIAEYMTVAIDKDFYDADIIRNTFISYGVDTFDSIPLEYRSIIARNINQLLADKGSDKVLIDICNLFGFKDISIFKLYLFKEHRKHADGTFIFREKDIVDPVTKEVLQVVPDVDKMYNLFFVRTPINANSPSDYIHNTDNRVAYEEITSRDKYWGNGEDKVALKRRILEKDFNFIETKYITLNTVYSLTELFMETNYFFRMIIDNQPNINMYLRVPTLSPNSIQLFDVIVALFALLSAKNGFDGNILDTTTKTLSVIGFNFNADLKELKKVLKNTKYSNVLDGFTHMKPDSKSVDILNTFFNNDDVLKILKNGMRDTSDYALYVKLKKVYDAIGYTKMCNRNFRLKNGTLAKTYLEYLKEHNFTLFISIRDLITKNEQTSYIDSISDITSALESVLSSDRFKFLFNNMSPDIISTIKGYLFKVINFFKSYTVDLDTIHTYYTLGVEDSPEMRIFDFMRYTTTDKFYDGNVVSYNDGIHKIIKTMVVEDHIKSHESLLLFYAKKNIIDFSDKEEV